ncbi:facilitated trehalose transporter Tret1-like [Aphis gossypii]|uniref:facilitated trehalose transporter Tret1-like n=1 Tax=Aphis gossypii TaxID=80765 RepID=UPI002159A98C|nr:facilitated trehalose transporter Tret1-like [Aphis gossypii]XP_027849150.2 facilitated trehalose transporter Tret1-like [Aphis gossypii]XP_050056326.1 facilitated trehalose transporter Tret1-like [Aphis gossypii]
MNGKIFKENDRLIGSREVEDKKSCHRQLISCFLASLMSLSAGTVVAGWSSTDGSFKDQDLKKWTTEQESWIISIYVFGALIGALPTGFLGQKYGRKSLLLWIAAPMIAGWLICLLRLESMFLECLGRFVCGLSVGATTVAVPLYAREVSSDVLRGRTGVFLDFMLCAGILYGYVARAVLPGLRQFCLACALIPAVFVLLFSYAPESPIHLYNVGQYDKAASALRWLRGRRFNVKNEFDKIETSKCHDDELLERSKAMSSENKNFLMKVTIISFGLVFVQRMTGAGGVIQYSSTLFKMSGSTVDPSTACIIVGTFQLVASGVSFLLIDKVGRRTLLLISSAVITTCLVLLIFYFSLIENDTYADSPWRISLLFVLCVFISAFRLGLGPIPWFISTELSPALYGGRIQSLAASFSWTLSFVIMKSFKIFVEANPVMLWCTFTAFSAAGFLFILFYVPETNNKSREQIRRDLIH